MGIGTWVRRRLGPLEIPATDAYRRAFIDIGSLAHDLAEVAPAKRILEVGCGDGSLAQRLSQTYPDASYLGIDIAPTAGRLYRGKPGWAEFRVVTVQELLAERPEPFDLVLLVDVIHHVDTGLRPEVLRAAADLVRPGGYLAIKEIERTRGPYYRLVYVADRYITGDRVRFHTLPELRTMMAGTRQWGFGEAVESRVRPARLNVLYVARRQRL